MTSGKAVLRLAIVLATIAAAICTSASPASAIVGGTAVNEGPAAPRIVGGVPASPHAYGWMVRLSVGCDGTLVAPRVVLTAGHCVTGSGRNTSIRVTGGSANLSGPSAVTVSSSYVQRAPGFKNATKGDDWAVIQLAKPLNDPLIAPTSSTAYDKGLLRVIGWGATLENGPQQTRLRTANVPFVSDWACGKAYHGDSFVKAQMICAGNLKHGGVDACQGDSGGPLVHRDSTGNYVEVGIVSWGIGCARAGYPGVYTQVSAFNGAIDAAIAKLS